VTVLEDQIRAWTDAAVADVAPVTASEALAHPVRRRPGSGPRRSAWLAAAAVVVVLLGVVGVVAVVVSTQGDDEEEVATETPGVPPDVDFTVLGVSEQAGEPLLALRSATTSAGVADLWSGARLTGPVPTVDLATTAVVSITISDDLCPPTLERFEQTSPGEITPVFVETAETCEQPEVARTFVVAIEWGSVGRSFRVRSDDRVIDLAPPLEASPPEGARGVWPLDATTADRSSPVATARSFVAHVLGSVDVEATDVSGSGDDEPHRVDITVEGVTTFVLVAPIDGAWTVMQVGESMMSMAPDPPSASIPTVPDAVTVEILVTTDRGVTNTVEDAVDPETRVDLPPGTLLSIAVVHRAEDGTLLSLAAGHF
jgi:hypothetical protein